MLSGNRTAVVCLSGSRARRGPPPPLLPFVVSREVKTAPVCPVTGHEPRHVFRVCEPERTRLRVCTYGPLGSARKTDGRFLVFPEYTRGRRNNRTQGLRRSKITRAAASSSPSVPRYARTRLLLPRRFRFSTGDGSAGPLGLIGVI